MPIYEYRCPKCGDFEAMQKISDAPLTQCPTCRRKVTKLISSTSFQLKGSGWYITDYARKSSGESTGKKADDTSATSEKPASDSTSSDDAAAKPDAPAKAESGAKKKSRTKPAAA